MRMKMRDGILEIKAMAALLGSTYYTLDKTIIMDRVEYGGYIAGSPISGASIMVQHKKTVRGVINEMRRQVAARHAAQIGMPIPPGGDVPPAPEVQS